MSDPTVGEATCTDGICGSTICGSRYKDCNASTADSCETDTYRDANNCGGCGIVCQGGSNAVGVCVQACASCCQGLYLNCNGDPSDGCEVNGASDLTNCGNCGNTCTKVGATTPACSAGSCGSTACTGSFRTCKAGPVDGCEDRHRDERGQLWHLRKDLPGDRKRHARLRGQQLRHWQLQQWLRQLRRQISPTAAKRTSTPALPTAVAAANLARPTPMRPPSARPACGHGRLQRRLPRLQT